ncbi:NUMOD3 domain-containing DNA-binding protein [Halobacillus kuroshimensis]|uniref:NUMOD3 domain-containing DNA-binding protein n=1 Tax=Halobacillus kuroshimensis TaxID=302481 RepID=UPI0004873EA7|nr:NUMOD3 domain-containing DNA-binding protein [Halobacillus kuroshimensis]
MEEKYYVYTHELDGEIIYVGKGSRYRAKNFGHRREKWKEIVSDKEHLIKVDIVGWFQDEMQAYATEEELIRYYKKQGLCKANVSIGRKHAEEIKSLISEKVKGLNNSMYGKTFTNEHKRNLSESRKGPKNHLYGKTGREHTSSKRAVAIFPNGKKVQAHSKKELVAIITEEYGISGSMINRLFASGEPFQARYKKHERAKGMVVMYNSA